MAPFNFMFSRRSSFEDPFVVDSWDSFGTFQCPGVRHKATLFAEPNMEWNDTPEAHVLTGYMPGMKKNEVKVEVEEGNMIRVTGEKSMEKEERNGGWQRVERSSGKFLRQFKLPDNSRTDQVKACFENGLLIVTVPKQQTKNNRLKAIPIQ